MQISAYIPSYNNAATIKQAIESISRQSLAVAELFVVDDCSTDDSVKVAEALAIPVIRLPKNSGRGTVRAMAMNVAKHSLVLCLDASKTLPADFVADSLHWFQDDSVAAVFGRIVELPSQTLAHRWCGRHLLKQDSDQQFCRRGSLITAGAIVKKQAVMTVGNYCPELQYAEDRELGERLTAGGFDVIFDPALVVTSLTVGNFWAVLDRYWRWHAPVSGQVDWGAYLKQILYSVKEMAVEDLLAGEFDCAAVSLLSPHYQLLRSLGRQSRSKGGNSAPLPVRKSNTGSQ
jgi:glycosyltransferase involved in cell wall biosynthesis